MKTYKLQIKTPAKKYTLPDAYGVHAEPIETLASAETQLLGHVANVWANDQELNVFVTDREGLFFDPAAFDYVPFEQGAGVFARDGGEIVKIWEPGQAKVEFDGFSVEIFEEN